MIDAPVSAPEFTPFPKIPRLFRDIIVTEKIDGTNAAVVVTEDGAVHAQSRKRIITPGKQTDNYGFAGWVQDHADDLRELGSGVHYGEWYGQGVQRTYGLDHRRFALFNVDRWGEERPACCDVVPVLLRWGHFDSEVVRDAIDMLEVRGSRAVPGFMRPEGVVVFHKAGGYLFKALIENDDQPKSFAA